MTGNDIRRLVIRHAYKAGEGHIGSALSVADILAVLYTDVLCGDGPLDPNRDRFVLSKGHSALALYAALHLRGWMSESTLDTYCQPGSDRLIHPSHKVPGIEFSTGSLGQGVTFAVGQALALKRQRSTVKVCCLLSDAECQEGSVWESVDLAIRLRLNNLILIVDDNCQTALGHYADFRLRDKFTAFGCSVLTVDGHAGAIEEVLNYAFSPAAVRVNVVLASTVSGKGVSFMESKLAWHYRNMNEEQCLQALKELA